MDKDGLQEPLGIMEGPAGCGNLDHGLHWSVGRDLAVEDPGPRVEVEINEQGTGILGQEDGCPTDLEAAVLEVQHGARVEPEVGQGLLILESLALRF